MVGSSEERTLIIGCDFSVLHTYWRSMNLSDSYEVVGFVYCFSEAPPIDYFKINDLSKPIPVFPLSDLEDIIKKERIMRCLFQVSEISMTVVQSIINRTLSTGFCKVEFLPPKKIPIKSFKPLFVLGSLSAGLGKTQLTKYFCNELTNAGRLVAIIMPITIIEFDEKKEVMYLKDGPHYQFLKDDPIPDDLFCKIQVQEYRKNGAYCIYVTSDVRRAVICAEQRADIILYDSFGCECPFVLETSKFCTISNQTINDIRRYSSWPGIVNLFSSSQIVLMSNSDENISNNDIMYLQKAFPQQPFTRNIFLAKSITEIPNDKSLMFPNQSVLVVEHEEPERVSSSLIHSIESNSNLNSLYESGELDIKNIPISAIPRSSSPINHKREQEEMNKIAKVINDSKAEVVVVSLQRDIDSLVQGKVVLHTSCEIIDVDLALKKWLSFYFPENLPPPLQQHFQAQADILMSIARASDIEIYVSNNDSANREAFCRLFLSSHLPPGFRVTTGEIIDSYNNNTGQLDVVIVNDECPRLTFDGSGSVIAPILADYVLGVVEVKTTLGTESLKKALSQIRHVKALMPSHETLDTPDGQIIVDPLCGKIVTGIFAFSATDGIKNNLQDIVESFPNVADFIVLPNSFSYFSVNILRVCGFNIQPRDVVGGYVCYSAYGSGLAMLYGVLNFLAANRRFNGSNCVRYLNGSWGGTEEAFLRLTSNIGKCIGILAQNVDDENKGSIYQAAGAFIENVKDIPKSSKKKNYSQPSLPKAPISTNVPQFI